MTTATQKGVPPRVLRNQLKAVLTVVIILTSLICAGCGVTSQASSSTSAPAVLSISAGAPPSAQIQSQYSAALSASGGVPPYTWALVSGSLPIGLTLGATGMISGTPTQTGNYSFTVQVSDSSSPIQSATQSFSLTVSVTVPLTVSTTSLSGTTTGALYSASLASSGGTGPYTWSISSGSLPAGLSLYASNGTISGTPTAPGTFTFTVQVTDSTTPTAQTATKSLSITVTTAAAAVSITTTSLANGQVGTPYSQTLTATGGTKPYTWSLASGTLPTGLALNSSTSVISGTPTTTVNATPLTFKVTDSTTPSAQTNTANLSITIAGATGHSVLLNWDASLSSATSGYNVYRSNISGSGYAKINSTPVSALNYADTTVVSGQTYFYVTTAVDSSGDESVFSNELQEVIP